VEKKTRPEEFLTTERHGVRGEEKDWETRVGFMEIPEQVGGGRNWGGKRLSCDNYALCVTGEVFTDKDQKWARKTRQGEQTGFRTEKVGKQTLHENMSLPGQKLWPEACGLSGKTGHKEVKRGGGGENTGRAQVNFHPKRPTMGRNREGLGTKGGPNWGANKEEET